MAADIVYELFVVVVVPCSKSDCVSKYASADLEKLAFFKRKLEISCPRFLLWHIQGPCDHDFLSPFTMNKKSLVHIQYRKSNVWLIYRYNVYEKYFIAFSQLKATVISTYVALYWVYDVQTCKSSFFTSWEGSSKPVTKKNRPSSLLLCFTHD